MYLQTPESPKKDKKQNKKEVATEAGVMKEMQKGQIDQFYI